MNRILNREFFKRDVVIALACAVVFSVFFALTGFDTKCDRLRDRVLRLHIIANSDSERDQAIKLKVRDRLLQVSGEMFEAADSKEQAIRLTEEHLDELQKEAEQVVRQQGDRSAVAISVGKAYFGTRVYDAFTLPAGEYDAVRVQIGAAEGKNWWCVMFPAMCVPAAGEQHTLTEAVDAGSAEIAENAPKYQMRFKTVEWYEELKHRLNEWF